MYAHLVIARAALEACVVSAFLSQRLMDPSTARSIRSTWFMSAGFSDSVAAVLDSASTDPGLMTLELTERVVIRDQERGVVVLDGLKGIGVKLALDDFGTGYCALGYLNTLPIDVIKLDRTFIGELSGARESQTIIRAIIQLAHGLGMTVICEGVETAEQCRELTKLGSDFCLGFYFAQSMSLSSLETLLEQKPGGRDLRLPWLAPGA